MKNDKMVRFLKNIMVLIAVLPLLSSTASWNTNR